MRNRLLGLRRLNSSCLLRSAEALDLEAARDFRLRFLQDNLTVQLGHLLVLCLRLARAQLLFTRGLGDALLVEVRLLALGDGFGVELQSVIRRLECDLLATGEDLMTSVLLVPLGERRR